MKQCPSIRSSGGLSRRQFIRLAAAAGLLAACSPLPQPTAAPTSAPTLPAQAVTATAKPTVTPTITPKAVWHPPLVKIYPDGPSKIIRARHSGVWSGDAMHPEALRQMLDAAITRLTGLNDAREAWAALFKPTEKIALKVNSVGGPSSHVPLAMAVAGCLQSAGVPANQITLYDRYSLEMEQADYTINQDGPGVRCYATDGAYEGSWKLGDSEIKLSRILLDCDALINLPLLKAAPGPGISFAMKNHYGSFNMPSHFHGSEFERAIPELNALSPIKDRTRLIVGSILTQETHRGADGYEIIGLKDTILMGFDPVAMDALGLKLATDELTAAGKDPTVNTVEATPWLEHGAKIGLGTNDLSKMSLVEEKVA
jgi:uncharacterized protein YmfQ (DUF2313 family)